MEKQIIDHDIINGTARITFTHEGVSRTDDYNLWALIPGTAKVFADLGLPFDEAAQLRAIDYLERNLIPSFASGNVRGDEGPSE